MPTLLERAGTLFQEEQKPGTVETLFNPLNAKINSIMKIENIDHLNKEYSIKELLTYDLGGGEQVSCYVARLVDGEDTVRLRIMRDDGRVRAVVCTLYDELDEEPGILGAVNDRGGIFVITKDGKDSRYTRTNDLRTARAAKVVRLSDRNGDGQITREELEAWQADLWDYSRTTEIDSVKVREYLFVERTAQAGSAKKRFRLWTGLEVLPDRIAIE